MDFHEDREKEPVTDLQEVLSMLSTLGGSEIWQLEWLIAVSYTHLTLPTIAVV